MGSDIMAGQCLQLHVLCGVCKASQLMNGLAKYGLISEAVSSGFDFSDLKMGDRQKLKEQFPEHAELLGKLTQG